MGPGRYCRVPVCLAGSGQSLTVPLIYSQNPALVWFAAGGSKGHQSVTWSIITVISHFLWQHDQHYVSIPSFAPSLHVKCKKLYCMQSKYVSWIPQHTAADHQPLKLWNRSNGSFAVGLNICAAASKITLVGMTGPGTRHDIIIELRENDIIRSESLF